MLYCVSNNSEITQPVSERRTESDRERVIEREIEREIASEREREIPKTATGIEGRRLTQLNCLNGFHGKILLIVKIYN